MHLRIACALFMSALGMLAVASADENKVSRPASIAVIPPLSSTGTN